MIKRLFPHQNTWKKYLRNVLSFIGCYRIASTLLKFSAVRSLLLQHCQFQTETIRTAIASAYAFGSAEATFPQSSSEMAPENFENYIRTTKDPWWLWIKEHLNVKNTKGLKLLDIGAGPGYMGHHFKYLGYEVTAVSGNPQELDECARRGMRTIQSDMHSLPIPAASYDAVLASHVLEHSIVPYILLLEIKRVLKPKGLLFINLPYPIEGNPALDYPDCYDYKKDEYNFKVNENTGFFINPEQAYYCYGISHHVFVLTYWQWRWLFKMTEYEHLFSAIEIMDGKKFIPPEVFAAEMVKLRKVAKNQHFILRKQ